MTPISSQETPHRQVSALNISSQETPRRQVLTSQNQQEKLKSSHRQVPANEGPFKLMVPSSISKETRPQSPTRPGADYDVLLNYRIEDEHLHDETSTAGMVRGAILEADNRDLQALSASRHRTPKRSSTRRQGDEKRHERSHERSSERSITPYRRQFDISRGDEFRYSPYHYT